MERCTNLSSVTFYLTYLHPALSYAAASIFLQLYLKPALPFSFTRSLFPRILWSSSISVALLSTVVLFGNTVNVIVSVYSLSKTVPFSFFFAELVSAID